MFTGLVEDVGTVVDAARTAGGLRLSVRTRLPVADMHDGDSVAVDGACYTVVDRRGDVVGFDVGPESLERTVAGTYRPGTRVNLERALAAGARLGGHFVLGHVDALGTLRTVKRRGDAWDLVFQAPESVLELTPPKGSICISGISLTVNQVYSDAFAVSIIPHTWANTSLAQLREGSPVNLESDMLARTVMWLLTRRGVLKDGGGSPGITMDTLQKAGFL